MNLAELVGALFARDFIRGRQERQHVRDEASDVVERVWRETEDIIIDELTAAANTSTARFDAYLEKVDPDPLAYPDNDPIGWSSAPFKDWARAAKPRLARNVEDIYRLRRAAAEMKDPTGSYSLLSELINALDMYGSAAEAYLADDFDRGMTMGNQAAAGWRQMQVHHGLAKYG